MEADAGVDTVESPGWQATLERVSRAVVVLKVHSLQLSSSFTDTLADV